MKELTVVAIKREDGLYHFDHPHNDTVEELLMNGTEEAIALIEVDGQIDQSVLAKVRELPQVVRADYLQFSS